MAALTCPGGCGRYGLPNVSTVVADGTVGSHATELARLLRAPEEPSRPEYDDPWLIASVIIGLMLVCGCAEICGTLMNYQGHSAQWQDPSSDFWAAVFCWAPIIIFGTLTAIVTNRVAKDRKVLFERELLQWGLQHRRWRAAVVIWGRLLFCDSDNIVIDPGGPRWTGSGSMYDLLYR